MRELWGKPVGEQILDQSLHFIWGGLNGLACVWGASHLPGLLPGWIFGAGVASWFAVIIREVLQWPPNPKRPYDPAIDCAFFGLGGVMGGVVGMLL